jgi:hypothetical protein
MAKGKGDILVYQNGGTGYIPKNSISTGVHLIDKWKVYTGYAAPGTGNKDTYPHRIISTPFIGEPALSRRRPISASALSTRKVRLRASCPISPVG